MKKKNILMALMGSMLFVACDPLTEEGPSGNQEIYAPDQLEITATPVVVDAKNSNQIVVENKSNINSQWTIGQLIEKGTLSSKFYDVMYATQTGTQNVHFVGKNMSCDVEKDLTVQIDTITYLTSTLMDRLCIAQNAAGEYVPSKEGAPAYFGNAYSSDYNYKTLKFFSTTKVDLAGIEEKIIFVQELDTVTGEKGNRIFVYNANPTLTDWSLADGKGKSNKNVGNVYITETGTFPFSVTLTLANGSNVELPLGNIKVEKITFVPENLIKLCGEGSGKTWEFEDDNCCGNGGYKGDSGPAWWKLQKSEMDGQVSGKIAKCPILSLKGDGGDAYFTLDATTMTMTRSDGRSGSFNVDFDAITKEGWSIGQMKTDEVKQIILPMGIDFNNNNDPRYTYDILKLTDKKFVVCAPEAVDNGCAWFWCFREKEEKE